MVARISFRISLIAAAVALAVPAAAPARAQDSTLLGAGAGAGGGAGIGFALGGPVGAVVGGLVGAGVGAGSGHLIGKEDKRSSAAAPATASGSDLTYQVQSELSAAGYNVGTPDGRYGPRTASAIRLYQTNNGLAQDGQPSVALLDHMRARRGVAPAPAPAAPVAAAPAKTAPVTSAPLAAPAPAPATAQPAGYSAVPAPPAAPQAQSGIDQSNCKPYETRTTIDGKGMVSRGTACLQKDGSWRTIN